MLSHKLHLNTRDVIYATHRHLNSITYL